MSTCVTTPSEVPSNVLPTTMFYLDCQVSIDDGSLSNEFDTTAVYDSQTRTLKIEPKDGDHLATKFVWVAHTGSCELNDPKKVASGVEFNHVDIKLKAYESFRNERFLVEATLNGFYSHDRSYSFTMTGHFLLRHAHAALKLPPTTIFSKVLFMKDVETALANLSVGWFEDLIRSHNMTDQECPLEGVEDLTLGDLCSEASTPESGRESLQ